MRKGIKGWFIIIPIIVLTAITELGLVINSSFISRYTNELATHMGTEADNVNDINSLQAGNSILSETATAFVYNPYFKDSGKVNYEPIMGYASEYKVDRRPDAILSALKKKELDTDIYKIVEEASFKIKIMLQYQAQAIALVRAVYNVDFEGIDVIHTYELTSEELALTNEEKLDKALELLLSSDYSGKKKEISSLISRATATTRARATEYSNETTATITFLKGMNGVFTVMIISFLILFFLVIIIFVVIPVNKFRNLIERDMELPVVGLYESRLFAKTYNGLIEKKRAYEKYLEESVELDPLTGLKSRYSLNMLFQQEIGHDSAVLFVLDVNYLKRTNDDLGHTAGDELIIKAADCIISAFNINDSFQAYRYGGDEFIVLIRDITLDEIDEILKNFKVIQEKNEVSIACGYEYTENGYNTSYSKLFKRADRNMYLEKEREHRILESKDSAK